jgi:hypothetical protein
MLGISAAVDSTAPAKEAVLVGTLTQCHSVFDCKSSDLQLVRVTSAGVVKKLGVIYTGIPDAQRLSTTVVAAGSASTGIYMVCCHISTLLFSSSVTTSEIFVMREALAYFYRQVLVTSAVDLNTTAIVLRVSADALSFTVAASKSLPYINSTSLSLDQAASCVFVSPPVALLGISATDALLLCRYASTWNGTVFKISLDSSLSLTTTTAGLMYSQPDVYPLAASPIDDHGASRSCSTQQRRRLITAAGLISAAVFPLLDSPCMHVYTFNTSSGTAIQVCRRLLNRCILLILWRSLPA